MVTQYGMSESLPPLTLGKREEMIFLGREISEQRNYGEKVADEIDQEVGTLVSNCYDEAIQILTENRAKLDRLAEYLIEEETAEGEPLDRLLDDPIDEITVSD
jgi:cell division protease FtsH